MDKLKNSLSLHPQNGSVAQLYRAPHYGCGGLRLESLRGHQGGDLIKIDWISVFLSLKVFEIELVRVKIEFTREVRTWSVCLSYPIPSGKINF